MRSSGRRSTSPYAYPTKVSSVSQTAAAVFRNLRHTRAPAIFHEAGHVELAGSEVWVPGQWHVQALSAAAAAAAGVGRQARKHCATQQSSQTEAEQHLSKQKSMNVNLQFELGARIVPNYLRRQQHEKARVQLADAQRGVPHRRQGAASLLELIASGSGREGESLQLSKVEKWATGCPQH